MSYLLDKNVASERTKRSPNDTVLPWIASQPPNDLFLSAATVAELNYGIEAFSVGD